MQSRQKPWTEQELAVLRKRWPAGDSAKAISAELRGRSRSSVIAMAARQGLVRSGEVKAKVESARAAASGATRRGVAGSWRAAPMPASRETRQTVFEPAPSVPLKAPVAAPDTAPVTFDALARSQCRYPVTTALPHLFCGAPRVEGSSYCAFHHPRTLSGRS